MPSRVIGWICLIAVTAIVLGARVLGPGDLYDKDQPKTMACTADIALNGHWIWPSDALNDAATKPPLYNWLDAIVLKLSPRWDEWAFKVPSILASLAVAAIIFSITRKLLPEAAPLLAPLAVMIWFANKPVMKQMYLSRPDMLLAAFLAGAWALGTRAIVDDEPRSKWIVPGFWLCILGAVLSKGPAAILPLIFIPLAAKLARGKWGDARRLQWRWGLSLTIAVVGFFAFTAYVTRPEEFRAMIQSELISRFTSGAPETQVSRKGIWLPTWWFIKNFFPWSIVVAGLYFRPLRNHPLMPALIWVVLCIVAFSVIPGKRADYLLPAYPAAAILAAYVMIDLAKRVRIPAVACVLVPIAMSIYLAQWEFSRSPEAASGDTRTLIRFAREADRIVPRDAPLILLVKGYHPLLALMGRTQGNHADGSDLKPGAWIVAEQDKALKPLAISDTLRDVTRVAPKDIRRGQIALYRIGDNGLSIDAAKKLLVEQTEWNFPPDRFRTARRD